MSSPSSSNVTADPFARIRIVLVRTSLPANVGAAARAMYTMGLTRLVLVAPKRPVDGEAIALAAGASDVLHRASVVESLDAALAGASLTIGLSARRREFVGRALGIRDAATEAMTRAASGDVALVFGTEMSGLTNDELAHCSIAASIPANPDYASLNLAAAVQVVAYELRVAAGLAGGYAAPRYARATHDEIEGLFAHARTTLTALSFLNPAMPKRLLPRLRRLFARAELEHEEVNILRGILARIDALIASRERPNKR